MEGLQYVGKGVQFQVHDIPGEFGLLLGGFAE